MRKPADPGATVIIRRPARSRKPSLVRAGIGTALAVALVAGGFFELRPRHPAVAGAEARSIKVMGDSRFTNRVRFCCGSARASSQIFFTNETGSTGAIVLKKTTVERR